jgi:hypothetical protein
MRRSNNWVSFTVLFVITTLVLFNSRLVSAQEGATNYVLSPTTSSSGIVASSLAATVSISTSITGTPGGSAHLTGCSSSVDYLWDYQNNVLQSYDESYSWIQQILSVGKSASCYTIEFWPDKYLDPNEMVESAKMITQYPTEWNTSGNTAEFEIIGDTPSGTSDNINEFSLVGMGAHSLTSTIKASALGSGLTVAYSTLSQQDFTLSGVSSPSSPDATFTAGSGTITYGGNLPYTGACDVTSGGGGSFGLCYQSAENSNMLYTNIQSNNVQGFSLVSDVQDTTNSMDGLSSVSVVLTPENPSDILVVAVGSNIYSVTSVVDSQGNDYTEAGSYSASGNPENAFASIWWARISGGSTPDAITATLGGRGCGYLCVRGFKCES